MTNMIVKNAVINGLHQFGVDTTKTISLASTPTVIRQNALHHWTWFLQNKKSSIMKTSDTSHTLLNILMCFIMYVNKLKKPVLVKNITISPNDLSLNLTNVIASVQASQLNNFLIKSLIPRRLSMLKHSILSVDIGSMSTELDTTGYFRVTGTIAYKAKNRGNLIPVISSLDKTDIYAGIIKQLLFPKKAFLSADLMVDQINESDVWIPLFESLGIVLDISKASDNVVVFKYIVTLPCLLVFSSNTPAKTLKKVKRIWFNNFFPQ